MDDEKRRIVSDSIKKLVAYKTPDNEIKQTLRDIGIGDSEADEIISTVKSARAPEAEIKEAAALEPEKEEVGEKRIGILENIFKPEERGRIARKVDEGMSGIVKKVFKAKKPEVAEVKKEIPEIRPVKEVKGGKAGMLEEIFKIERRKEVKERVEKKLEVAEIKPVEAVEEKKPTILEEIFEIERKRKVVEKVEEKLKEKKPGILEKMFKVKKEGKPKPVSERPFIKEDLLKKPEVAEVKKEIPEIRPVKEVKDEMPSILKEIFKVERIGKVEEKPAEESGKENVIGFLQQIFKIKKMGKTKAAIERPFIKEDLLKKPEVAEVKKEIPEIRPVKEVKGEIPLAKEAVLAKEIITTKESKLLREKGRKIKTLKVKKTPAKMTLVIIPNKRYLKNMVVLVKDLDKKYERICYVSLNEIFNHLTQNFEKNAINTNKFFFIDAITKSSVASIPQEDNCIFVLSPNSLIELSVAITKTLERREPDVLLFDSLSTLLIYEKETTVTKFIHSLIGKIKAASSDCILTALETDAESEAIKDLGMFVDEVLTIKEYRAYKTGVATKVASSKSTKISQKGKEKKKKAGRMKK